MIKSTLKRYFVYLYLFYTILKWRIAGAVLLSSLVGLLDGVGIALFIPLLSMAELGSDVATHHGEMGVLAHVVDGIRGLGVPLTLNSILLVMLVVFATKGVVRFVDAYYRVILRTRFMSTVRLRLIRSLTQISYQGFVKSDAGQIQNTVTAEVGRANNAFGQYFSAIESTVLVTVYIGLAFAANAKFAVLVLFTTALVNVGYRFVYRRTKSLSRQLSTKGHWYHSLVIQCVHDFKYLKATATIEHFQARLNRGVLDIERTQLRMGLLESILIGMREPLVVMALVIVVMLEVSIFGGVLSTILLSILFFYRALSVLIQLQSRYNSFLHSSGALDGIWEFQRRLHEQRERSGKEHFGGLRTGISVQNLCFSYDPGRPILKNISVVINKNEMVALAGHSGSGKTTLVNLLVGLLKPTSGAILVDGMDLRQINLEEYRRHVGYISQESVVFSDSFYNNVTLWAPPTVENQEKFRAACESAAIWDFVQGLPDREMTPLGDNGVLLSGGQKQRVSIARELFKGSDILVFDEATSALDSETERSVQENLEMLRRERTIIVVVHRLSTIRSADQIIVLEDGRVQDAGAFDELAERSPTFSRMVELQSFA